LPQFQPQTIYGVVPWRKSFGSNALALYG